MEIKPLDMQVNSILYSLKIWLTSVAVAPLIYIFLDSSIRRERSSSLEDYFSEQLMIYGALVILSALFSFVTWMIFIMSIKALITWLSMFKSIKAVIAVIGVLFTVATFAICFPVVGFEKHFLYLMISNCICIAAGSLYYRLEVPAEQNEMINN